MTEHIYESAIRNQIAQHSTDSKKQLQQFSAALFDIISQGLLQDGHVRIHQFGSFKLNWANERRGRHPKTGEALIIPAQPRISFTPAKALKEQVNALPMSVTPNISALPPAIGNKGKTEDKETTTFAREPQTRVLTISGKTSIGSAGKTSRPLILNRKTALAVSIVVALIAALLIMPAGENEKPPMTSADTHTDTRNDLEVAVEPDLNQAGHKIITVNHQLTSNQVRDAEHLLSPETITSIDPTTVVPALPSQNTGGQSSKSFFRQSSHKLLDGDSLWRLSGKHYINPFYWPHIYQANRTTIDNPNKLRIGSEIKLPRMHGTPGNLTSEDRRSIAEGYFLVYQYHKKTNKPFPYYALLGTQKFDPAVIQEHISEISEQDWHSLQLANN